MTIGLVAMLVGIFVVPGVLVWAGQKLRRRSARWRSAFWGATIAHLIVMPVGLLAGFFPPVQWGTGDVWRGLLGFWAFVLGPVLGAIVGGLLVKREALDGRRDTTLGR